MFFQNANYSRVSADTYTSHKLQWLFEKHTRRKGYFTRRRIRFAYVYERYKEIPTVGTTEFLLSANLLCQNHRFFSSENNLGLIKVHHPFSNPFKIALPIQMETSSLKKYLQRATVFVTGFGDCVPDATGSM